MLNNLHFLFLLFYFRKIFEQPLLLISARIYFFTLPPPNNEHKSGKPFGVCIMVVSGILL